MTNFLKDTLEYNIQYLRMMIMMTSSTIRMVMVMISGERVHDKSQDLKWNSGFYFLPVVTVLSPTVSYLHLTQKEEPLVVINGKVTVRNWRHRLQRAFLGKSDVNEKMMPDIDEVFKSIEAFEMKMEWLTSSKLGKVLKQVGALDNSKVPLDEKYNIRARA
ncbi:hypothetical protein BY996DRAFT_6408785 [Phakopsora pachyrhizi]|nr:hypothetical protein BY996DRAFT_6408785 [Phakopsora pachyrhizi]